MKKELTILLAMLMALAALAIDAMLPAMPAMGAQFNVTNPNHNQYIISSIFLGMSLGQLVYGPLSDSIGRKPPVTIGLFIFIIGCLTSIFATSFNMLLAGRFLQGLGVASPRVVSMAIIRDQFKGNAMAEVMSLIMMVFVIVPAIAPSIGQFILLFSGWQAIFYFFIFLSLVCLIWFITRQEETLPLEKRIPISHRTLWNGAIETLTNRTALGYTLTSGLIFGAFIGYLTSSQQVFQTLFGLGKEFPLYFGALALAIGFSSFVNSKLVHKFGMKALTWNGLRIITALSILYISYHYFFNVKDQLWVFMIYMLGSFFCVGILFGNFNSLALEPLGHIAGIASAVISTVQNLISVTLGTLIGLSFNGTTLPLAMGFTFLGIGSLLVMKLIIKEEV